MHVNVKNNLLIILMAFLYGLSFFWSCYYYLEYKTSFFDDTFIYLHMAANVLESGSAQYFQPEGLKNTQLLASSPLHLYFEIMAGFFVKLFGLPIRTLLSAKVILILNGLIMNTAFSIFWRRNITLYAAVSILFWLFVSTFDSMLEMEGGLLFLVFITLLYRFYFISDSSQIKCFFVLGILFGLLLLTRVEIFVGVAVGLTGSLLFLKASKEKLLQVAYGFLVVLIGHIVICSVLGVYPLPSTIWSKQITASVGLVSIERFVHKLPNYLAELFILQNNKLVGLVVLFTLPLISIVSRRIWLIVGVFAYSTVMLLVYIKLPSHFVWYYQNAFLSLLFGFLVTSVVFLRIDKKLYAYIIFFIVGLMVLTSLYNRYFTKPVYPWDFSEKQTRAQGYLKIAASHIGNGLFKIGDLPPAYIRNPEIGIISFFSGRTLWMYDLAGLAQIGNLQLKGGVVTVRSDNQAYSTTLKYLYPKKFQITGEDELRLLENRQKAPVFDVWGVERGTNYEEGKRKCYYFDGNICVNRFRE